MAIILDFNQKEKKKLLRDIERKGYLFDDSGTEGNCFLINNDVYKIFSNINNINNNICKDDLDLESFLFPNEIYTCNQIVFACKTDTYIKENKIHVKKIQNGEYPNLNNIKTALEQLIKDLYVLSRNHIFANDLAWCNILFDGEKFYAIDTLSYEHHNELDVNEIYEGNIHLLIHECCTPLINYYLSICSNNEISEETKRNLDELIPYIKETAKRIQEECKDKEVQKIKKAN